MDVLVTIIVIADFFAHFSIASTSAHTNLSGEPNFHEC